jgi:transcriptional regulator with XRE-family HTH domain
MTLADRRSDQLLAAVGRDVRAARLSRGLSQKAIAVATGLDQADVSRIERGRRPGVSMRRIARLAAAVGLEVSLRTFPGGEPVRDKAHAALLGRFRKVVGEKWRWAAEVPLPIPGDKRAWDRMLRGAGLLIGVEAETRPTDMQELQRRLALKKRDGNVDRLILVLPNSEWCRRLVRMNVNDIEASFPVAGKVALRALQEDRDPGGDAAVMV